MSHNMCGIMRRFANLAAGGLWLLCLATPVVAAPVVDAVRIGDYQTRSRFVVDLNGPVSFKVFTLADPYRVVIDLPEVVWRIKPKDMPRGKRITGYRLVLYQPGKSRIVMDVAKPIKIEKAFLLGPSGAYGHRLVIDLADITPEAFLRTNRRPVAAPAQSSRRNKSASVRPPQPPWKAKKLRNLKPLIAIDPGHGGVDPGARGVRGSWEKTITLSQARELRRQLIASGRYRVILTRGRDIFVRLRERIAIAQRAEADVFISLHADSIANRKLRGGSVYTLSEKASDKEAEALASKENKADIIAGVDFSDQSKTVTRILIDLSQRMTKNASVTLAKSLIDNLGSTTKMLRRTHRFAGFAVLKAPEIPSVLIEMGYLSNPTDEKLLRSKAHQKRIAKAILVGINAYIKQRLAFNR
jgi:N-acetylmuramoyl-L-alanine amidase